MKTRGLGFLLMVAAASVYAVGCGSSSPKSGTGGAGGGSDAGTGGKGTGGAGMGGMGTAGMGMGGKMDAGPDSTTDTPVDGGGATFTQVYAIISDKSTATSPGCTTCHDGVNPADGGVGTGLPHGMNFTTKAAAYAALFNVDSIRCPGGADAGGDASTAALKRVLAGNAAQSVLVQKLMQGMGVTAGVCDTVLPGMPLNVPKPTDGGSADGGDAGFTLTTYMVTAGQLATIQSWINAGALNN